MEHQTEQINAFFGKYKGFSLDFAADGRASSSFSCVLGREAAVTLTYSGYTDCPCRLYVGDDNGIIVHGDDCLREVCDGVTTVRAKLPSNRVGLFFFHFELDCGGSLRYLSPDGMCDTFSGEWQYLVCDDVYSDDYGFSGGAIYHVFVDRFAKGGDVPVRDDAVMLDWQHDCPEYPERAGGFLKNNTFFGGTLWGVAKKLPYIRSLGVDLLYLSPVFTAYSNHKYDTGDFMSVDPMFGGDDALRAVINGCHTLGMKVILDGVFNHVGDDSVYFDVKGRHGGAFVNPSSPYREWFDIQSDGSYECWWGVKNLPKVIKCGSFQSYICDTVIPKYMRMGIDGWRLDVVDEYSQSFLEKITAAAKAINPHAYILGEVWEDASNKTAYGERKQYLCGRALDGVMNYPFRNAVIDFITSGDNEFITDVTTRLASHYPASKLNSSMNMLGTHDTARILTVLGGVPSDGLSNAALAHTFMTKQEYAHAKSTLLAAYTLLAALPGKTAVYYGDEAGMEGYGDPFNRRPFPWGSEDGEITRHIQNVNRVKAASKALTDGEFVPFAAPDGVFAFRRVSPDGSTVTCVSNMSDWVMPLEAPMFSLTDKSFISQIPAGTTKLLDGTLFCV